MTPVRGATRTQKQSGRRLTARSVIASTLLGVSPPELSTRSLVATAELLGIAPGTARGAKSRMVAAGELAATADGYRLVGPALLARQDRQVRSRAGTQHRWDGTWRLVVVGGEARAAADRVELRTALAALRFAELREGAWTRPANLDAAAAPAEQAVVERQGDGFTATSDDPVGLAARLWDLEGWAATANDLLRDLDRLGRRLAEGDASALADGFVLSAAVLRHFQADPLLPPELLPASWPGPALRERYDRYDADFRHTLAAWQRHHHADAADTATPARAPARR
jgi:phenylacetic acid degradation operon negative regulatory protein